MKRLLACLLAVLLLPAAAAAEAYVLDWQIDMPQEAVAALFEAFVPEDSELSGVISDSQMKGVAKLIDGLGMRVHTQTDAMRYDLSIGGGQLMSMMIALGGDGMDVCFDLLDDVVLRQDAEEDLIAFQNRLAEASAASDWQGLYGFFLNTVNDWSLTLDTETEQGAFAGEAYSGGMFRVTYRFDDRDLLSLLQQLLCADTVAAYAPVLPLTLEHLGADLQDILKQALDTAVEAAKENRYAYTLRIVNNGLYNVGVSVTVMLDDAQVTTLSVGLDPTAPGFVLGYGLRGENIYLAALGNESGRYTLTMLRDPQLEGFAAACRNEENVLLKGECSAASLKGESILRFDVTGPLLNGLALGGDLSCAGKLTQAFTLGGSLRLNGQEIISQKMIMEPAEELTLPTAENRTIVSMADFIDGSDAAFDEFTQKLTVRLFKLLPPELFSFDLGMLFE